WNWRAAFLVVGLPGLFVALAGLLIHDPGRGASEGKAGELVEKPRIRDYLKLFRTRSFLYNTAGLAAVTYATGGYAVFGSEFYQTVRGMSPKDAGLKIGALTALAGLLGIVIGTGFADFLLRFTRRAYLLMASLVVLASVPFGVLGILSPDQTTSLAYLFGAMVLLAMVLGPCNTVTANVVPSNQRAAGYAVSIFLLHLLGDISSPIAIGAISEWFGRANIAASPVGQAFASIGAGTTGDSNLTVGMLSVAPVLLIGFVFFLLGSRHLPEDQDRATASGGPPSSDAFVRH
ncbi:MFS transporter, partial [Singulisphaera rosea]